MISVAGNTRNRPEMKALAKLKTERYGTHGPLVDGGVTPLSWGGASQ